MEEKRTRTPSKGTYRALKQYKDMPEEEFNKLYDQIVFGVSRDEVIQARYDRLMQKFEDEYDLTEMLPNDRMILSNLVNAMIQLQDYEAHSSQASKEGISAGNILVVKQLNDICKGLRDDISKMQTDLGITRRVRKNDKEQTVLTMIEDLKKKANQFYQQKMNYVFCPNCNTVLATVWWLYPDYKTNSIHLECHREIDGKVCGGKITLSSRELMDMKGSNKVENLPESMK